MSDKDIKNPSIEELLAVINTLACSSDGRTSLTCHSRMLLAGIHSTKVE